MKSSKTLLMLSQLRPYVGYAVTHWQTAVIGIALSALTVMVGVALLGLSGWFLSAAAVAGLSYAGIVGFNFYTPAAGVRLLSVLRTAGRYGERLSTHQTTLTILTQIRVRLWQKLQTLSIERLSRLRQGDALARLLNDIDALDQLYLRILVPLLNYVIWLTIGTFIIAMWDINTALICGAMFLLMGGMLACLGYLFAHSSAHKILLNKRRYRIVLVDFVQNQVELHLFDALESYRKTIGTIENYLYQAQLTFIQRAALVQSTLIILHGAILLGVIYFAVAYVTNGVISGVVFAMCVFMNIALMELLQPVAMSSLQLSACLSAANRINDLTTERERLEFGNNPVAKEGSLTITNLDFAYFPQHKILTQLSLQLAAKTNLAVVGHSGCGKSSLLKVITRQFPYQSGDILLDGQPLEGYSEWALSQSITLVEQRVQLFSATLRDNLTVALSDGESVTEEKLQQVIEDVGLSYLLEKQGLELWLGEGGRLLSGGEQRRLSIARALLRTAPLVILDEPTEGLDAITEQQINQLILRVWRESTLLLITHRTEILPHMDSVLIMNNGQLVACDN